MKPENKHKARLKAGLEKHYGEDIYIYIPQDISKNGVHDMFICYRGMFITFELKGEGKVSALQERNEIKILDAGGKSIVLFTSPEKRVTLNAAIKHIDTIGKNVK